MIDIFLGVRAGVTSFDTEGSNPTINPPLDHYENVYHLYDESLGVMNADPLYEKLVTPPPSPLLPPPPPPPLPQQNFKMNECPAYGVVARMH